jgi:uncharacterized protein with HEPN domain
VPSRHDPTDSLADIVENAERIERYLNGMDRAGFGQDGLTRDAVERCIERVCEAAHRLGALAEALMPGQPWGDIRGMGNRLRHAYDRIDPDIIWNTARERIPTLAVDARRAIIEQQAEQDGPSKAG